MTTIHISNDEICSIMLASYCNIRYISVHSIDIDRHLVVTLFTTIYRFTITHIIINNSYERVDCTHCHRFIDIFNHKDTIVCLFETIQL